MSKVIRAITKDRKAILFVMDSTDIVEQATTIHNLPPIPAAALGRLLTAASMMGLMLKSEDHTVSLQIQCNGVLRGLVAVADSQGNVKGYVKNKEVITEINKLGKLNVKGAIGNGTLTVIKDLKLKEPYIGQIQLVSGEIAEDITHYFAISEQTPSAVALGVLIDKDLKIVSAGGMIIQLLPDADNKFIELVEQRIRGLSNFSKILKEKDVDTIAKDIFEDIDYEILNEYNPTYKCDCSYEKAKTLITLLNDDEINDQEDIEIVCSFCEKKYIISREEAIKIKNIEKNEEK
ncbi:Hsp33 family molecular chaperone HslO [Caldicellulosiruptoraceae bacterium PP1]